MFRIHTLTTLGAACALLFAPCSIGQDGPIPPKAPGVVRIGLVKPKVQMGSGDAAQSAEAVRGILADYLSGPTIEVALLNARLPSQFAEEARQADCDFTLTSALVHRRAGEGGSVLGKALGNFAGHGGYIPGSDAVKTVIVSGVMKTAADFASSIKAKDEMRLEFQLDSPGASKPLLKQSAKARAAADGEDLLTPLVEKAAEAVGAALSKTGGH
jgi:hypothetical protein